MNWPTFQFWWQPRTPRQDHNWPLIQDWIKRHGDLTATERKQPQVDLLSETMRECLNDNRTTQSDTVYLPSSTLVTTAPYCRATSQATAAHLTSPVNTQGGCMGSLRSMAEETKQKSSRDQPSSSLVTTTPRGVVSTTHQADKPVQEWSTVEPGL